MLALYSTQVDATPLITAMPTLCPCHCLHDNLTNKCADKLDVMMLTMFEYIEGVCFNEGIRVRKTVYWRSESMQYEGSVQSTLNEKFPTLFGSDSVPLH